MEYVDFQRYEERRRVCREGGGGCGLKYVARGKCAKIGGTWAVGRCAGDGGLCCLAGS